MSDSTISRILYDTHDRSMQREALKAAARSRAAASAHNITHNTSHCPGCGSGFHRRYLHASLSLLVCPNCGFSYAFREELSNARAPGEGFLPGVTGRPNPTVVFGSDGKIKRIRNI